MTREPNHSTAAPGPYGRGRNSGPRATRRSSSVSGLVDERFLGFGELGAMKTLVINVAGMTRMTSFGVRQWLKAMDALPKSIT